MIWEPVPDRPGAERSGDFLMFRCRDRRRLLYAGAVRVGLFRTTREARRAAEKWAVSPAERAGLVAAWFERERREEWERLERTRPRLFTW